MENSEISAGLEDEALTQDLLLGGRVSLRQPKVGYRAGLDAALLAGACDASEGERVIDAGCGAGAALLAAAVRRPGSQFFGVERDPAMAALAGDNIHINGLEGRVQARAWDVSQGFARLGLATFDAAICNPPFHDDPSALRGPHPARAGAYLADGGLEVWTRFLLKAVREGGAITIIHRADRLADILGLLSPKAGSFRIRPVHPFPDVPAKRVLVRAVKTGKAPLMILPPLVLHERDGAKHTAEAEGILRGETELGWG
jgi:tRNA1(Val) A37 N6-methylase TrmN6